MKNTFENVRDSNEWKHTSIQLEQENEKETIQMSFFTKNERKIEVTVTMIGDYISMRTVAHHGTLPSGENEFMSISSLLVTDNDKSIQRASRDRYDGNNTSIGELEQTIDMDGKAHRRGKL